MIKVIGPIISISQVSKGQLAAVIWRYSSSWFMKLACKYDNALCIPQCLWSFMAKSIPIFLSDPKVLPKLIDSTGPIVCFFKCFISFSFWDTSNTSLATQVPLCVSSSSTSLASYVIPKFCPVHKQLQCDPNSYSSNVFFGVIYGSPFQELWYGFIICFNYKTAIE